MTPTEALKADLATAREGIRCLPQCSGKCRCSAVQSLAALARVEAALSAAPAPDLDAAEIRLSIDLLTDDEKGSVAWLRDLLAQQEHVREPLPQPVYLSTLRNVLRAGDRIGHELHRSVAELRRLRAENARLRGGAQADLDAIEERAHCEIPSLVSGRTCRDVAHMAGVVSCRGCTIRVLTAELRRHRAREAVVAEDATTRAQSGPPAGLRETVERLKATGRRIVDHLAAVAPPVVEPVRERVDNGDTLVRYRTCNVAHNAGTGVARVVRGGRAIATCDTGEHDQNRADAEEIARALDATTCTNCNHPLYIHERDGAGHCIGCMVCPRFHDPRAALAQPPAPPATETAAVERVPLHPRYNHLHDADSYAAMHLSPRPTAPRPAPPAAQEERQRLVEEVVRTALAERKAWRDGAEDFDPWAYPRAVDTLAAFALAVLMASGDRLMEKSPQPPVAADYDRLSSAILSRLYSVAVARGIPVQVVSETATFAGRYTSHAGRPVGFELRRDHVHYLVFAHELGHHIAIARRGDHSELAAEEEAHRLILSVLSDDEAALMRPILDGVLRFSREYHAEVGR